MPADGHAGSTMPRRNRATPLGELESHPARGLVYGNRGCLHDRDGRIARRYAGRRWIACRLEFRGWLCRPLMQQGRFTELFFLDEATALAGSHRPCALCRRADYRGFVESWGSLHGGERGADLIDARLHGERVDRRTRAQLHHAAPFDELPDGTFVLHAGEPWLVLGDELFRWTHAGYDRRATRPSGSSARVVTPPSLVAILREGWVSSVPFLHPSASRHL